LWHGAANCTAVSQIIHRDLKSPNILVSDSGVAKVSDFGFARFKEGRSGALGLSGSLRGTPAWIAPEVLQARTPELRQASLTIAVDVYAYGIILWELLERKTPFKGMQVGDVYTAVIAGKRPLIRRDCPGSLKRLIEFCWHADPRQRPSMAQVLLELKEVALPSSWRRILGAAGFDEDVFLQSRGVAAAAFVDSAAGLAASASCQAADGGRSTTEQTIWVRPGGLQQVSVAQVPAAVLVARLRASSEAVMRAHSPSRGSRGVPDWAVAADDEDVEVDAGDDTSSS
jgi:hypothetical protein